MRVTVWAGDLLGLAADAICTSTNPRLSLLAGTGGDVVRGGGWTIQREAQALLATRREGEAAALLEPGTVVTTTAGRLPYLVAIHCVASDGGHRSSPEVVRRCTGAALAAAQAAGCATVAMPIFGSGHAALPMQVAAAAMAEALLAAPPGIEEVRIAVLDPGRARAAAEALGAALAAGAAELSGDR